MSEWYEGVVVTGPAETIARQFAVLESNRPLRLVRLADATYGIYSAASRTDSFDEAATEALACQLSRGLGSALAVLYDNRAGLNRAALFVDGAKSRQFDEQDELWVELDDDGYPAVDGPTFAVGQLIPENEYDCIRTAIDAGLVAMGVSMSVSSRTLKQAFSYDDAELIAESKAI